MTEYFCSALELMVFLPGMLLAYLPMKGYLRMHPVKLAAVTVPLTLFLCLLGSAADCFFHIGIIRVLFPAAVIMGSFYIHTLKITRWKSVSVFLAICGAFSCLGSASLAVNGILIPGAPTPPLSLCGALFWFVICCVSVLAVWYPATHAARRLLQEEAFAQTWYIFWLNAMEARLKTAPERRQVKASARLHSGHMVLLSVENTYDGKVREKDCVLLSSKRPGEGIGLQAVQHTAEKNGGYCRFHYEEGTFCVNVILRGMT